MSNSASNSTSSGSTWTVTAPLLLCALSIVLLLGNTLLPESPIPPLGSLLLGAGGLLTLLWAALAMRRARSRQLQHSAAIEQQNQEAILRLLDELEGLSRGDLTTQVTVSEAFTGAIADSINFTIEQLRQLVISIHAASREILQGSENSHATALQLAEAAQRQASEIGTASASISQIATSIEQVSSHAAESSQVAERSVTIANSGAEAVTRTIHGMTMIREQIQSSAKRVKRLGESSQEIGDFLALINDIADQTNILALNAAIQASMAGEAGRGFAVVADEVQRLAERSSAATRQIEALVRTIQSDTNEAVLSMEETTSEVVRGSQLAQEAGVALDGIKEVSASLAQLISHISSAAQNQSGSAAEVARTMGSIQEITTQTAAGAAASGKAVGDLSALAHRLRQSVDGFTLPVAPSNRR